MRCDDTVRCKKEIEWFGPYELSTLRYLFHFHPHLPLPTTSHHHLNYPNIVENTATSTRIYEHYQLYPYKYCVFLFPGYKLVLLAVSKFPGPAFSVAAWDSFSAASLQSEVCLGPVWEPLEILE